VRVTHFTRVLQQEVGSKKISEQILADLSSLRVAPHYGCHYTKPSTIHHRAEDPENPKSLDELIEATGAHSVNYEDKLQCCGGGVLAIDEQVSLAMAQKKLDHVRAQRADAIVLICPFCNVMYESNQRKIEKVFQKEYKLPVLFYPQLLGLALGMAPEELGLNMNRIKPNELLKKVTTRAS
jgi:heterodisulfide reductase subunit B